MSGERGKLGPQLLNPGERPAGQKSGGSGRRDTGPYAIISIKIGKGKDPGKEKGDRPELEKDGGNIRGGGRGGLVLPRAGPL